MPIQVPAIDQNACRGWDEQDIDLYNTYPFYLAKSQVDRRKWYAIWSKFLGKKRWTPNMGSTMKAVRKEMSPHLRQFAFPNEICAMPKVDVTDVREMTETVVGRRHRFESQIMHFCPSFRDFFNDHLEPQREDLMEKMERFEDVYIRGNIWYLSPYVWFPNRAAGEDVVAPRMMGNAANNAANSKNTNWLAANLPDIGNPGNLSLATINKALVAMETDRRATPFTGSMVPKDGQGMQDKFVLVCDSEAWNQFTFDPYLQANKNCNLDVVNESFKGSLFGRITCRLEDLPLRIAADGTVPTPMERELGPQYNIGESILTAAYMAAPFGIAYLIGGEAYDMVDMGPPPSAFTKTGEMVPSFNKMFWNGELFLTKNFLIECADDAGVVKWQTNMYNEHIKFAGQATYAVLPKQRRNILPIIYRRKRGAQLT